MERLTDLQSQISDQQLTQAVRGKQDPYSKKTMKSAYLWTDGEETVCDQLTVTFEDGEQETYYGFDAMSLIKKVGLTFEKDNGRDVSHLWD